jgi:hypothetical protein
MQIVHFVCAPTTVVGCGMTRRDEDENWSRQDETRQETNCRRRKSCDSCEEMRSIVEYCFLA